MAIAACTSGPSTEPVASTPPDSADTGETGRPVVDTDPPPAPRPPNILLVVADDLGIDNVGAWNAHPQPANTPTIDGLAATGVRFDLTWGTPSCSPARAQILTGRVGRRYGLGDRVSLAANAPLYSLPEEEVTLAEIARTAGYSTSFIGKWHLTSYPLDWEVAPARQGFDWFAITGGNLNVPTGAPPGGGTPGYTRWERNENGTIAWSSTYVTTSQADDAIARIRDMPEPWLLVLAFNAPHEPFHVPPAHLHTLGDRPRSSIPDQYRAAVEAMDTELRRVLESMPPAQRAHTNTVFVADNGTPKQAVLPPLPNWQGKPSATEGGLRVPLIVSGPDAATGVVDDPTQLVDLFPTLARWMDVDLATVGPFGQPLALDGIDLGPWLADPAGAPAVGRLLYAEQFDAYWRPDDAPFVRWMMRDPALKYAQARDGSELMFDLRDEPWDLKALYENADSADLARFRAELDAYRLARPLEY